MTTKEYLDTMLRPMADYFSAEFAQRLLDLRASPELQRAWTNLQRRPTKAC
jgi:hypothetical protein